MLQAARRGRTLLGSAAGLTAEFVNSQGNSAGGFCNRAGEPDLYYTTFGLEAALALEAPVELQRVRAFLATFGDGAKLDLVHRACLARCWADLRDQGVDGSPLMGLADAVEGYRSTDGGYNSSPGGKTGTVYAGFLALGIYQDLGLPQPEPDGLADCLASLAVGDGGFFAQPGLPVTTTPTTAAVVTALGQLGRPIPERSVAWLLARHHADGGFTAMPNAPAPDLLSSAVALHALRAAGADVGQVRPSCRRFVEGLRDGDGSFRAGPGLEAEAGDCEYTYYGLLGLGHLALA